VVLGGPSCTTFRWLSSLVGQLRTKLRPGTRVGFIEPDFRAPLAQIGYLEATGRADLSPLRVWPTPINYCIKRVRFTGVGQVGPCV